MRNPNTQLDLSKKVSKIEKGIKIDKKYMPASNIQRLVKKLKSEEIKGLKNIQAYFAKSKDKVSDKDAKIISSVMNAKQDGKKIYINTNLFTQRLNTFVVAPNVLSKCFSNDRLNLWMIKSTVTDKMGDSKELYEDAYIDTVKIISENFKMEEKTEKGFVQDYDPDFSVLGTRNYPREKIETLVANKPNEGEFSIGETMFSYFGDANICIIVSQGTSDEDIIAKWGGMKFLRNNRAGKFELGERKVYPNENNDLCYIDKDVVTENFCPAYWISEEQINFSYLFTCFFDYNELFDQLDKSNLDLGDKGLIWPSNLCYWYSINECFQFLSILVVVGAYLNDEYKDSISTWCDEYFSLKTSISLWKNNQLLYQRILQDFLYGFLNNSDAKRFENLLVKVEKYLQVLAELQKHPTYASIKALFGKLPFAQMINKQFTAEVTNIATNIKKCIQNYLSGAKPDAIIREIRSVAKSIQNVTARNGIENAAFPILVADGGLLGDGVNQGVAKADPIFDQVFKNAVKTETKKIKDKKEINEIANLLANKNVVIKDYLRSYVRKYLKDKKLRKTIPLFPLIRFIQSRMDEDTDEGTKVIQEAVKFRSKNKGNGEVTRINNKFLNDLIKEYLDKNDEDLKKLMKGEKIKIKTKKKDDNMIISDDEEDEKEEVKSADETSPRYNLRSNKK